MLVISFPKLRRLELFIAYRQVFNTILSDDEKYSFRAIGYMSDDKKPTPQPPASSQPSPQFVPQQSDKGSSSTKNPVISRRAFVVGALGVSALLTVASVSQSGGILNPLLPDKRPPLVVANYQTTPTPTGTDLNSKYMAVKGTPSEYDPTNYSEFFYYPYKVEDSPYYKNVVARLPDPLVNPYYPTDQVLQHVIGFNLTCVHLRCIVNPGYSGNPGTGEYRLICPCHGSQYRLTDAHPVAGPAFNLGLLPLPRVKLQYDSTTGNITATDDLDGNPGIGRTD